MSTVPETEREKQSFAETALRMGGKSEEEVTRMGAMDKADEQVEKLYAERLQTTNSPVHRAVWDGKVPVELFAPPPLPATAPCDAAMDRSIELVKRHREAGTLYDENEKISQATIDDLSAAGYWGMLIPTEYGGQGAPFARYARFHTRMSAVEEMIAGMGSVHGCIGAVDPLKAFGTPEQKRRFLPNLQTISLLSDALGPIRMRLSTNAIRTIEFKGGIDAFVKGTPDRKLAPEIRRLKRRIMGAAAARQAV